MQKKKKQNHHREGSDHVQRTDRNETIYSHELENMSQCHDTEMNSTNEKVLDNDEDTDFSNLVKKRALKAQVMMKMIQLIRKMILVTMIPASLPKNRHQLRKVKPKKSKE